MVPAPGESSGRSDGAVPSGLSVVVAGCDGSWTGPAGAGSGYVVVCGTTRVLVDAGPGYFRQPAALAGSRPSSTPWSCPTTIPTIGSTSTPWPPTPIWSWSGPAFPSTRRPRWSNGRFWPTRPHWRGTRCRMGLSPRSARSRFSFHRTDHSFETLAMRIDGGGRSLGYSADTGPGWSLDELGVGLDLVLSEATYTVEHEGTAGHMSGRQAGEQARRAEAGRLVITHRWPTIDPVAARSRRRSRHFGGTWSRPQLERNSYCERNTTGCSAHRTEPTDGASRR